MSLRLTIQRGARQIGGVRIEIEHPDGERIVLDAGRPLDAPEGVTGIPTPIARPEPAGGRSDQSSPSRSLGSGGGTAA